MNKQAMSVTRAQGAQSGFTLIELIVVIVILGILAATALPRFSNLSGDARAASLSAVRGSLTSTAATAHGAWLVNPTAATVTFEGVAVNMEFGYPKADANFLNAAGIVDGRDYKVFTGPITAGTANSPTTAAGAISIVPNSVVGTTTASTCYVTFTPSTALNTPPTITAAPSAANCL